MGVGPIAIDEYNWGYVEDDELLVIHEVYDERSGGFVQTDRVAVPWRVVRLALAIHDKGKRPRTRTVAKDGQRKGRPQQPVARAAGKQKTTQRRTQAQRVRRVGRGKERA